MTMRTTKLVMDCSQKEVKTSIMYGSQQNFQPKVQMSETVWTEVDYVVPDVRLMLLEYAETVPMKPSKEQCYLQVVLDIPSQDMAQKYTHEFTQST